MDIVKDKNILREAYTMMYRIRALDLKVNQYTQEKKYVMGIMHSHIGAEAYSVATMLNLREDDYMATTYRNHAHAIARDVDLNGLVSEFCGKKTGVCKGMAGNMHCIDQDRNIIAAFGIIGAGMPPACGTAFASKYRKEDTVTCVFFGDGAVAQGAFHESMNLASIWNLPVLFINDNNGYAMSTATRHNLVEESTITYAKAYNIPCVSVNGLNFFEVYSAVKKAVEHIRTKKTPYYIECKGYRYDGQWEGDPQSYKPDEEKAYYWTQDPVKHFEKTVAELNLLDASELEAIRTQVDKEVMDAFEFAANSDYPDMSALYENIYADEY